MRLPWKSTVLGSTVLRSTVLGSDYAQDWRSGRVLEHESSRPTVLVETEDGAEAIAQWRNLERHGYRMQWCPGPDHEANRRCSLVETGECQLVDQADVVISHLDFTREAAREALAALCSSELCSSEPGSSEPGSSEPGSSRPAAPVLVAMPSFVRARFPQVGEGCTVLPDYLTGHRVVAAVGDALGGRREAP